MQESLHNHHPLSTSVEEQSLTLDSLIGLVVASAVNFKISTTDSMKEPEHTGYEFSTKNTKIMISSTTNTSADITMTG
ncbi:hypothetical protein DPMN_169358 [Dreissena polymorpha]|uniref:Uncharacterized protein n=1 Tax=Dreissena polymorpha TaxID=45954 RepID=A0A9D4DWC3_DREPO|nr:hypothetical protein DPMN_169358 [Dreissena polymorpha]